MQIDIKVVPGASTDQISGWLGSALKLLVRAAPEKGKANRAVIALLAHALDVPPATIRIERGQTRALKRVAIDDIEPAEFTRRMGRPDP